VKTPAPAARVECLEEIAHDESQIMLRIHRSIPRWRIVFSTFFQCMSFYTAWVTSVELGPSVTFPLSPPEADVGADIVLRRLVPIVLQKSPNRLCEIEICNDRIGARAFLNRCCAFAPDLESMLRDKMLKILLQQYLHERDLPATPMNVRCLG
jgi:hypothetical protein